MAKAGAGVKVGTWLAGILAVVIGSWVTWKIEQPPPAPTVTTVQGMVYAGNDPVARAMVAVELTGSGAAAGTLHDVTDPNGAYRFEFTGLPKGSGAILTVAASGFQSVSPKIWSAPLQTNIQFDVPLSPLASAAPPAPGLGPHLPAEVHLPPYIPKPAAKAARLKFK